MAIIDWLWEMLQLVVVMNEQCLVGKEYQSLLIKDYYKTANKPISVQNNSLYTC